MIFKKFFKSNLNSSQNEWDCGCEATDFKLWVSENEENWIEFQRVTEIDTLECNSPKQMTNYTLYELDLSWFPKANNVECRPPVK